MNKTIRTNLASLLPTYNESTSDTDDLRLLGLDSLRFVELIVRIEDEMKVEFPDDKLSINLCYSIALITEAISQ